MTSTIEKKKHQQTTEIYYYNKNYRRNYKKKLNYKSKHLPKIINQPTQMLYTTLMISTEDEKYDMLMENYSEE